MQQKALKPINTEEEVSGWSNEWNEETARRLEQKVAGQMEDYEYLLQYSI